MKKNRIFTSALAAVVLLAAGCSDDLENQGNGAGNGELNGTKTYMKVSVNPGVVTKAAAGEEGDTSDDEEGEADEYAVKDVTVILFRDAGETYGTAPTEFKADSKLVAAGFGTLPGNMDPSSEDWHKRMATVTLEVTQDQEDFDDKTYGIIAVTNLGENAGKELVAKVSGESATVNDGAALANLLQNEYKTNSGFIMSTHNDQYGSSNKIFDKVTLQANVNPNEAPQASVHVERLAAKVRISKADDANDFIYKAKEGNIEVAKIRLDEVAIVNQLSSGSFLLKRVTAETTDGKIPAKVEGHDLYLGNETVSGTNATNYVIDPWTRNKKTEGITDWVNGFTISSETLADAKNLSYTNHFVGENFQAMWNSYTTSKPVALANNTDLADADKLDLAYTMENTTSAVMSKNGFSTGALFKATYIPKELMTVTTEDSKSEVAPKPVENYNPDGNELTYDAIATGSEVTLDFYLYANKAYDSYEAIFNEYVWGEQKGLNGQAGATIYSYTNFKSDKLSSLDKKTFFTQLGTANDPLGYIAAMREAADSDDNGELSEQEITAATLTDIDQYIANNKKTLNKNINVFEDCVCYYPYWIRHADNNNGTEMGVMEFAIVRNNIYDLKVTGISGYGYSGIEKPEPGTDNETKKFFFNVEIFVKNWVVRSNSDIIL